MAVGDATGRWLVTFRKGEDAKAIALVQSTARIAEKDTTILRGYDDEDLPAPGPSQMVVFDGFGVAVTDATPAAADALRQHARSASSPIRAVEPERIRGGHAIGPPGLTRSFKDDDNFTWGLRAMRVPESRFDGTGVKIAILDTGLDTTHPDFAAHPRGRGRNRSFLLTPPPGAAPGTDPRFEVRDVNPMAHGTADAGAAVGPVAPALALDSQSGPRPLRRRYGVAPGAELYVARVLDDNAEGPDGVILRGLRWALTKGCHVILMPLGSENDARLAAYDQTAGECLAAGLLVVASAGNAVTDDASQPGPIHNPAKAQNVLAVGAVNSDLRLTRSSPIPGRGPAEVIDVVAPGLEAFTSVHPSGDLINERRHGTSVAAAYVAGIAALHSQATGYRGQRLWDELVDKARRDLPETGNTRLGAGLVQAP